MLKWFYSLLYYKVKCDQCGKIFYRKVPLEKKNVCSMGCAISYFNKLGK
jgi:hypothetical protein